MEMSKTKLYDLIRWGSESPEGYAPAYCRICGATLSTYDETAPIGERLRWCGCEHIEAAREAAMRQQNNTTHHNRPVSAGQGENMENCLWYVPLGCMGGEWIRVNSADEARNYLCRRVKDFSMSSDPVSDLVAINQVTGEKVTVTLEEAI